jgi:hypothetical protein
MSIIKDTFSLNPKLLVDSANLLGGSKVDFSYGDYVVKINSLPLIPILSYS